MRYIIRHYQKKPVPRLIVFAKSNNLEGLKRIDYETTQIVDTKTGEIISNLGERSKEYGITELTGKKHKWTKY